MVLFRYEQSLCRNQRKLPMAEMSPLARILMMVLQRGSWAAAALILAFAGILLYQRYTPDGFVFQKGDFGFLGVLAAMLVLAVYLVRGIKKEMQRPGVDRTPPNA
jgi:hypothetical protein